MEACLNSKLTFNGGSGVNRHIGRLRKRKIGDGAGYEQSGPSGKEVM